MCEQQYKDGSIGFPKKPSLPGAIQEVPYVIIADDTFHLLENMNACLQCGFT